MCAGAMNRASTGSPVAAGCPLGVIAPGRRREPSSPSEPSLCAGVNSRDGAPTAAIWRHEPVPTVGVGPPDPSQSYARPPWRRSAAGTKTSPPPERVTGNGGDHAVGRATPNRPPRACAASARSTTSPRTAPAPRKRSGLASAPIWPKRRRSGRARCGPVSAAAPRSSATGAACPTSPPRIRTISSSPSATPRPRTASGSSTISGGRRYGRLSEVFGARHAGERCSLAHARHHAASPRRRCRDSARTAGLRSTAFAAGVNAWLESAARRVAGRVRVARLRTRTVASRSIAWRSSAAGGGT